MSDRPMDPDHAPDLAAWREAYRGLQTAGSPDCPDDETLAALATGEPIGAERERLADHVALCRRCADRYRMLRALHQMAAAEPVRDEGSPPQSSRRFLLLVAAASLLVVVGLVGLTGQTGRVPDQDRLRGPAVEEGVRPAPEARLAAPPRQLAWPASDGALSYRVILYDAGSSPLWKSGSVAVPRLALPDAARSRLASGESYFWVVEVG
ncbi:MAG TPA: TraR/DksA C4-type zinc finger protein, partial [Thermoanaerobaculia bacterium]|nr:TraR/DksA C4-type zinc finger protein [Thermoanaerobaculia bacterium]